MQSFTVTLLTLGTAALAAGLFWFGACLETTSILSRRGFRALSLAALIAVIALRLGFSGQGFELAVDAGTFKAWAAAVARMGLHGLYGSEMMVDYPPLYLAILGIFGSLAAQIGLAFDSPWFARLLVCGPILFELATAVLLARVIKARSTVLFASAFLLIPHIVANSTFFGQVDAAPTFLVFAACMPLAQWLQLCLALAVPEPPNALRYASLKKISLSALLFALTIMTKPIAILFGPIGLVVTVAAAVAAPKQSRPKRFGELAAAAAVGCTAIAVIIWLAAGLHIDLALVIIKKYWTTLGSYPYASLNAANFWGMIGENWIEVGQPLFAAISIATVGKCLLGLVIGLGSGLAVLDLRRIRQPKVAEAREPASHSLSFAPVLESICFYGALQMALIFTFADQMHERYLYSGATLLIIAAALRPSPQRLLLACSLSLLVGLNQSLFLDFHAVARGYHVPALEPWLVALSFSHVVFTCFLVRAALPSQRRVQDNQAQTPTGITLSSGFRQRALASLQAPLFAPMQKFTASECYFASGITLVAAALSFFQLGSRSSPQTFWRPHAGQPTQELTRRFALTPAVNANDIRITGFFGLGKGSYAFRVSSDGEHWHSLGEMGHDSIFDAFAWKVLGTAEKKEETQTDPKKLEETPAAFLEIEAIPKDGDTVAFHEVGAFLSKEFNDPAHRVQLKPVTESALNMSQGNALLIDEQDAIPVTPSYLNEMIFDEVYHVRSAYEEILGQPITETSHPPFGKTLIGLGISTFGNNPFGWRVVGAFLGFLLVPLAWFIMRLLSGNRLAAAVTAFLFCFDFLRYSQTRMATLDGILVFLILAAMALLLAYGRVATNSQSTRHLSPAAKRTTLLFCSGTLFGFGIAAKWSVIYLAPVIAILFICFLLSRFLSKKGVAAELGLGILFLIVWPLFLYYGAFNLSHFRSGEGHTFSDFWNRQISMYRYHSELKATHPFSSKWWEWPIIARPLWLYSGPPSPQELGPMRVRSIVAMGSPLIWWASVLAVAWSTVAFVKQVWEGINGTSVTHANPGNLGTSQGGGFTIFVLLLSFFGLYAPWVVSPRSLTFIYHYFPVVPFALMILAALVSDRAKNWSSSWILVPIWVALASFVFFFPVLSGYAVDRDFINVYLRWFPSWIF
jgi:4-amino-4-deoxy-L-arabinose transferase-like glycosyltransferase